MKKIMSLLAFLSTLFLTACVTPTMENLPQPERGKGVVVLYSSSLRPTAFLKYTIDDQELGDIEGAKVRVIYLAQGNHGFKVKVPSLNQPLNKTVFIEVGHYYFFNIYSTTDYGRAMKTTYYFESVPHQAAMAYLQGPKKFTGWRDLVTSGF